MAPYGVIAAITPSTHPVPTMASNAIGIIAAGNAAVFNAHPAAKQISAAAVQQLNTAIVEAGGPANLITIIEHPTVESATQLFNHAGVDVILVTGGPSVARAAMSCPKKAIVAGPGNPPVVVDETADLERAARDIVDGASFDNNLLCIGEKQVFVVDSVADSLKSLMVRYSAYELNPEQIEQLAREAFVSEGGGEPHVNRELVGRDAAVLGARIGLQLDDSLRLLIGETDAGHIFVREEQMMPFVPIIRVPNVDQGIRAAVESEHGYRHTAVIHSRNIENMHNMARAADTTVFVKNGPSYAGLGIGGEGFGTYSIRRSHRRRADVSEHLYPPAALQPRRLLPHHLNGPMSQSNRQPLSADRGTIETMVREILGRYLPAEGVDKSVPARVPRLVANISARHLHLNRQTLETLFGSGAELTVQKKLYQEGAFAAEQMVTVFGPRQQMIANVPHPGSAARLQSSGAFLQ